MVGLKWARLVACILAATPLNATAQACEVGTISKITFDRQKPFPSAVTSEDQSLGWAFRSLNSVYIRRAWPTQADRSRRHGIESDLTTRAKNPLARN